MIYQPRNFGKYLIWAQNCGIAHLSEVSEDEGDDDEHNDGDGAAPETMVHNELLFVNV